MAPLCCPGSWIRTPTLGRLGASLARVDLVGVETEEEAVALVAERATQVPAGTWIVGTGWDEGAWARSLPRHAIIVGASSEPSSLHAEASTPSRDGGIRMAFERAGITAETEAPVGGEIRKDAQGQPTGLLLNRAVPLLVDAVPAPAPEQLQEEILAGLTEMTRSGFVAVHDAGVSAQAMAAFEMLEAEGQAAAPRIRHAVRPGHDAPGSMGAARP